MRATVFVRLSGGVDSSVSAALLLEAGFDVTGVFIKVWQPDFLACSQIDDRRESMRAAAHLGIPWRELDLEDVYKREVVDYMIAEYTAGRIDGAFLLYNQFKSAISQEITLTQLLPIEAPPEKEKKEEERGKRK